MTSWYTSQKKFSFSSSHHWPRSIRSRDHHLNAEWGMTTAGRCSATAAGTRRCRSRWHQSDSGHRRSSSHTRTGTCWSGYGRSPRWGRGQTRIRPAPTHTCQNDQHFRCRDTDTKALLVCYKSGPVKQHHSRPNCCLNCDLENVLSGIVTLTPVQKVSTGCFVCLNS